MRMGIDMRGDLHGGGLPRGGLPCGGLPHGVVVVGCRGVDFVVNIVVI